MNIYPYNRGDKSTHPKEEGLYLILVNVISINRCFWTDSQWRPAGFFDWELDIGSDDNFMDSDIQVLGYAPLPKIENVLNALEKGKVYNDTVE